MSYSHSYVTFSKLGKSHTSTPRIELDDGDSRFESLLARPLNDRDREFITSLRNQFDSRGDLSTKQVDCLVRTEEKYSPATLALFDKWSIEYNSELKETAKIVANYYISTHYFRDMSVRIMTEDGYVPTKRQYNAMCKNRYAAKAIAAAIDPPLFPVGSICKVRKNSGTSARHQNEIALVTSNHNTGLYASSTVLVCGETVKYEDRLLKPTTRKRKSK
jgi:hypothetical protein